jgi:hypothetical protein
VFGRSCGSSDVAQRRCCWPRRDGGRRREFARARHDLWCVAGMDLGGVLGVGDVADPVQAVLDLPVPADQPANCSGRACCGRRVGDFPPRGSPTSFRRPAAAAAPQGPNPAFVGRARSPHTAIARRTGRRAMASSGSAVCSTVSSNPRNASGSRAGGRGQRVHPGIAHRRGRALTRGRPPSR